MRPLDTERRAMLALTDPKPYAGYCFDLTWAKRSPWTTPDTAWEVAMTGDLDDARWLGQREIDGTLCDVWRASDGTCFAQTAMAVSL